MDIQDGSFVVDEDVPEVPERLLEENLRDELHPGHEGRRVLDNYGLVHDVPGLEPEGQGSALVQDLRLELLQVSFNEGVVVLRVEGGNDLVDLLSDDFLLLVPEESGGRQIYVHNLRESVFLSYIIFINDFKYQ